MHSSHPQGTIRSCPCKLLPTSFSSFTAAEYGDLHSLSRSGLTVARRRDGAGYSPLHLAAQQNHVAATALLLQLGCPVDGDAEDGTGNGTGTTCGATPLHRAAFSGATASMRILLVWQRSRTGADDGGETELEVDDKTTGRCNLLARDTSFGDESTPLHKAAAGGRYLAVQLLLEALRERPPCVHPTNGSFLEPSKDPEDEGGRALSSSSSSSRTMLSLGTSALDKWGRTPLDVAYHYFAIQDRERRAVARWDEVAGGVADWGKCIELLEAATPKDIGVVEWKGDGEKKMLFTTTSMDDRAKRLPPIPKHLTRGVDSCLTCNVDASNGHCLTASWVAGFQKALMYSVSTTLPASSPSAAATISYPSTKTNTMETNVGEFDHAPGKVVTTVTDQQPSVRGATCSNCHQTTISLYPTSQGLGLVCKACRRTNQKR